MTARQLIQVLIGRRILIMTVLAGMVSLALAASFVFPKIYTSEVSLVIDPKERDPVSGLEESALLLPSRMATQVDVIASHNVALRVVDKVKLADSPETREAFIRDTDGLGSLRDWLADKLLKTVQVKPSRESNVITIRASARDPGLAQTLANEFADAYIQASLELTVDPARRTASWFDGQLRGLRGNIETAQKRVSDYQRTQTVVGTDDRIDVENTRLVEISNQLVAAQAAMFETRSRLNQMNLALQRNQLRELPDLLNNSLLQSMKADLARAESTLAETAEHFGTHHPKYVQAAAEVRTLRAKLSSEIQTARGAIIQAAQLSERQASQLQAALEDQRDHILKLKSQQDDLQVLKREVESAQRAFDIASQRASEVRLQSQLNQSSIAILNPAVAPRKPTWPNLPLNIIVSTLLGLTLGTGAALALELFDRRVRSAEDVTELTGLLVLAEFDPPQARIRGRNRSSFTPGALGTGLQSA